MQQKMIYLNIENIQKNKIKSHGSKFEISLQFQQKIYRQAKFGNFAV